MKRKMGSVVTGRSLSIVLSLMLLATLTFVSSVDASARFDERTIPVEGSNIVLKLWNETNDHGAPVHFYEIIQDGRSVRTRQASYELGLRYAHFDPSQETPEVSPLLTAGEESHLYIVQFVTQPLEAFAREIDRLGGTVHHYIAQYAYLVEMDEMAYDDVSALPYVRWVGRYHPAYRLEENLFENAEIAWSVYPSQRYNIQVMNPDQKIIVANRLASIGAVVNHPDAGKVLVEATLNPDQLFEVADWDQVLFIDHWSEYEEDMDVVRQIGGANYIETVAGYTGEGVAGEAFDGGCQTGHIDFQSDPLMQHGTVGISSHGTACAGVCFGDGTGNITARGLMPDGQGIVASYLTVGLTGTNRYNNSGQLVQAPYNAVFQTASVGSDRTTQYTTISADADAYCFDFDLVHCQSQSNAGTQMSRPQAWAKNMVSGGGIRHYNTLSRSDDMWSYGASIGPASDGRIKPTFTHFYDLVYTTYTTSTTGYGQFSGTSSATPIIAGHIGLFFQMWSDGIFGNSYTPGATVFENRSHASTAKAMLVASAYQYDFTGTTDDKTRVHQGWGMPDLQRLYDKRNQLYIVDEEDVLTAFEVATHTVSVPALEPELKIVMVYPDPPGNPSVQTQHRINDLTLKVISPSNVVYWGNNNLYVDPYSLPGGSADDKNTVECVFLENPEAGDWTIEIHADEIVQDGNPGTPAMDAVYALVALGVGEASTPDLTLDLTYLSGSPVPTGGGDLDFEIYAENVGSSAANFDGWLDIEYEGGAPTTVAQRYFSGFQPGWTINRPNMYFPIPGSYAAGNYEFIARMGDHPGTIYVESGFPFTKSGTDHVPGFVPFIPDGATNPFEGEITKGDDAPLVPSTYALNGAYPNPFNPTTTLSFTMPEAAQVNLAVYDVNGRLVANVVDGWRAAGTHEVTFDAASLSSGVYIYRMTSGAFTASGKMILMK